MIFNDSQLSLLQIDPTENATLETLLNKNLTLNQLLSVKNIQPKIKSSFTFFIKYCQRNQQFSNQLIDLAIKTPQVQTSDPDKKQIYFVATDALTCDQDIVADLLILSDNQKPRKTSSANQSDGFEQIEQNIQTQAESLAVPQQSQLIDQSLGDQQKFEKKCKYLRRVLNYIIENDINQLNENCINYMIKALNCLIRKKADEFLQFLDKKPKYLQRLIELNNFSSINQFLIKIISDDDIHYENVRKIKEIIIEGTLNKLKDTIGEEDFNERLDFLDELFQTNKYASEDDRTELQKLSDIFSSKATIDFFFNHLSNPKSSTQFYNSICYLSNIVRRMNIDEEVDPYSYSNEPKEETMIFELDILFKGFPNILRSGYSNLVNLKFADQYKQKMVETRFYDLLVLMTKNSRFSNSSKENKHGVTDLLKGNNIIFSSQNDKISAIKELIQQFFTQAKSGINRVGIIALLEKVLSLEIYQQKNHLKQQKSPQVKNENKDAQTHIKETQKQPVIQQTIKVENDTKTQQKNQHQDCDQTQEKKKKINQFKTKLKLDIKKFSSESHQQTQKPQEKKEVSSKKIEQQTNIKKLESSLPKSQVIQILQFLSDMFKSSAQFGKVSSKKKLKNNDTEISALINKIIMLLSNSVAWVAIQGEQLTKQKDEYINQVQALLSFFNFEETCRNYSTTLATSKHPNATAKQKTNPQLNFIAEFVRNFSKRKQQTAQKSKQSSSKNLQLSDSEFKSEEEDDEEEIHAQKCSLEDFKRLTGFKFETDKIPNKPQPIATDRSSSQARTEITNLLNEDRADTKNQEVNVIEQATQAPRIQIEQIIQEVQEPKVETVPQKQSQPVVTKKEETKVQNQNKPVQKVQKAPVQSSKKQTEIIKIPSGPKIQPVQFYVRHRVIFV